MSIRKIHPKYQNGVSIRKIKEENKLSISTMHTENTPWCIREHTKVLRQSKHLVSSCRRDDGIYITVGMDINPFDETSIYSSEYCKISFLSRDYANTVIIETDSLLEE